MKRREAKSAARRDWIIVREHVGVASNQCPGPYVEKLFKSWVEDGWEIVSVTPMPAVSSMYACIAVGVLRRGRTE